MTQFKPPDPPFLSLRLKLLTLTNCFPNLNRYHPWYNDHYDHYFQTTDNKSSHPIVFIPFNDLDWWMWTTVKLKLTKVKLSTELRDLLVRIKDSGVPPPGWFFDQLVCLIQCLFLWWIYNLVSVICFIFLLVWSFPPIQALTRVYLLFF